MILIDTELMKQLANSARTSNDAINDAMNILNQVTTHNDWGCKERYQLNEYIQKNKGILKQLQEFSGNYLRVILEVMDEFDNVEKGIPNLFESVEEAISQIISIPIPQNIVWKKSVDIIKKIGEAVDIADESNVRKAIENVGDAIRIVKFDDIDLQGK